jgi:hypothetical protein
VTRREADSDLERFHKFARNTPITYLAAQEHWGDDLYAAFSKFSKRTNRKTASLFSSLSDREMEVACDALRYYALEIPPSSRIERTVYSAARYFDVLNWANLIAILIPTTLKICPSVTDAVRAIARADTKVSDASGTPVRDAIFRSFPEKRVDLLHGWAMSIAAEGTDYQQRMVPSDVEWFGQNRDRIIPVWPALLSSDVFDPKRVEVLLENSSHSALSVIDGAL